MIITKDDLVHTNDVYWDICSRASDLLRAELDYYYIDVDEIHVDPEKGYVFVFYSYRKTEDSCTYDESSKTYRINKFLSLINKGEKIDTDNRIPVELNGAK